MARKYWLGEADAVAQVSSCAISSYDVLTTYSISLGNASVSVIGAGGLNPTAVALAAAADASTHPYFEEVTWTDSGNTVIGTADDPGEPFDPVSGVSGGTGTIGAFSDTTACESRHHWDVAANWSDNAVPVNSDEVIVDKSDVSILWGLAQSAVTLAYLSVTQNFTGKVGLDSRRFALSSDAETYEEDDPKAEYRDVYLQIGASIVEIGENPGPSQPAGSPRIMLNLGSVASQVEIFQTASQPSELGLPVVRILANSSSTDIIVREAIGGVGVAVDAADETSTIGDGDVSDLGTQTRVTLGEGVTWSNWRQYGGTNRLRCASGTPDLVIMGGVMRTEGDWNADVLDAWAGVCYLNHTPSSGNQIATLNLHGGTCDWNETATDRTVAALNWYAGGINADSEKVTFTAIDLNPDDTRYAGTLAKS